MELKEANKQQQRTTDKKLILVQGGSLGSGISNTCRMAYSTGEPRVGDNWSPPTYKEMALTQLHNNTGHVGIEKVLSLA